MDAATEQLYRILSGAASGESPQPEHKSSNPKSSGRV